MKDAIKGLKCCTEFACYECPYQEYEHPFYKFQCIRILHEELVETLKEKGVVCE